MLHKLWYFWYVFGVKIDISIFLKLVWYCLKDSINVDFMIFSVFVYFQFKQRARRTEMSSKNSDEKTQKLLYTFITTCIWKINDWNHAKYICNYWKFLIYLYIFWNIKIFSFVVHIDAKEEAIIRKKKPMNNFTRSCETHSSWGSYVKTNDIKIFY